MASARCGQAVAVLLCLGGVGLACTPPAEEIRVVDVGAWAFEQASDGTLSGLPFGELEVRFEDDEASSWPGADPDHQQILAPPARGRFYAQGDVVHGASRSVNVDEEGRRYRTLYLAAGDALPCYHLPGSASAGRDVPNLQIEPGAGHARVSCTWDASGLRVGAEGEGAAALEWDLSIGAHQEVFVSDWVGGSARETKLWADLTPSVGSVTLSARDGGGAELERWPAQGPGRLLLLPALIDAVDRGAEYSEDPFADFEAAVPSGERLSSLSARYLADTAAVELRLVLGDPSAQAGQPSDNPEGDAVDSVVLDLGAVAAGAPTVRAVAGRDGSTSAGTPAGISASSDDANPWALTFIISLDALSADPLGKNDLLHVCLHAYLDPDAAPRAPAAVWPVGCDQDASRSGVLRLFEVAE